VSVGRSRRRQRRWQATDVDKIMPAVTNYREGWLGPCRAYPPPASSIHQRLLRESGFQEVTVTGHRRWHRQHWRLRVNALVSFKVLFSAKSTLGP
jgi:hypothetical protein